MRCIVRAVFGAALVCGSAVAQDIAPAAEYRDVARLLSFAIEQQIESKGLPAISVALVDGNRPEGQQIVWAKGFGFADAQRRRPASAQTVYRVGSVSKLFTDLAIMQQVEKGRLLLDEPIATYLPEFHPANSFKTQMTLRRMMSHSSGLMREAPVGHYFDDTNPSLRETVLSLNRTPLVYAPGSEMRYSNAAVGVVGYALEKTAGMPYAEWMQRSVLAQMQMNDSAFTRGRVKSDLLADGRMWTYDGLEVSTPTFDLGEAPAGSLYSNVTDLSRFLEMIFRGGKNSDGTQLVQHDTLQSMMTAQKMNDGTESHFGLGFVVGNWNGRKVVGHSGGIYGFSSEVDALPDERLGIVILCSMDSTNAVVHALSKLALEAMLARASGGELPKVTVTEPLKRQDVLAWSGRYEGAHGKSVMLEEHEEKLMLNDGNSLVELKQLRAAPRGTLVRDSRLAMGEEKLAIGENMLSLGGQSYRREADPLPTALDPQWKELIGEYGWDYDKLYVLEDHGKLTLLIEWFELDPLTQEGPDSFRMPKRGLYDSEKVSFVRDAKGQVTGVTVGAVLFKRRALPQDGEVYQLARALKPVDQLRREALAATPPTEDGARLAPDLVELTSLDPTIKLDVRYASTRNFLGAAVYAQQRAFMQRPAAEAVAHVSAALRKHGYGLLIHDAYRPWYVTKMFWDGTPDDRKIFVADPSQGSRHNRGCAVDLTLYDLKTGKPLVMTGGYDEMSERSYPFYMGGTSKQRWQRDLLRRAMEAEGFTVYEFEWWHFDYKDWKKYPLLNVTFEQMDASRSAAR
ncbi:MAG: serine hydrolase [Edaphobacter sp.]|uniref:serine hydrolase n=1 Tax=Edaphobacter sp. TaxID=1934404 RepID=UPI002399FFD4|nr:serine hydrolase [Edaphobacter sp.]MDE1175834.1 serine hydrolase [Edaphobacter sp.]